MKLYLSSYKIGDQAEQLLAMVSPDKRRAAYIANALDAVTNWSRREQHEQSDIAELEALGFEVDRLDLRDYFGKTAELQEKIGEYGLLWLSGGNTFVLRQAMALSGFDQLLDTLSQTDLVYGGYSAAVCVLGPTLKGLQIVDDPTAKPYGEDVETIWDGLDVLDYLVLPHYDSDHPESADIDKEVAYCEEHNIPYRTLRDGEVIVL